MRNKQQKEMEHIAQKTQRRFAHEFRSYDIVLELELFFFLKKKKKKERKKLQSNKGMHNHRLRFIFSK
jgi:hypothetical protein